MALPEYFLADLADAAALTPRLIADACGTLKSNRRAYLQPRSTSSIIATLAGVAENWLDPAYPLRRLAATAPPDRSGFSAPVLMQGLDSFFRQITAPQLKQWIEEQIGDPAKLDGVTATAAERQTGRASTVHGPELMAHFAAGKIPCPVLQSMILGLLARSAQFVKCATGASFIPRLFAHSIREVDPKLAACLELAEWKGGSSALEAPLFEAADCVTATGSDAAVESVRGRVAPSCRFIAHGHKLSFGIVAREILSSFNLAQVVRRAAADVAAWDQLGCLSPHAYYVEAGGAIGPETFAAQLAAALEQVETVQPRAPLDADSAAAITTRRAFYQVRAAHSPDTVLHASRDSTAWTVLLDPTPAFQPSCLNRFIFVKPVASLDQALESADPVRGLVSTVGLAATEDRAFKLAQQLAAWGAARVCPIGRMQDPPLCWRHDGRPALADVLRWTDWETSYER